jgi:hypothetical protein
MVLVAQDTASIFMAEGISVTERSVTDFQDGKKLIGTEGIDKLSDAISGLKINIVPTLGILAGDKDDPGQEDKSVWKAVGISQDSSVKALLTDRVKSTLDYLIPIVTDSARGRFIPLKKVELHGYVDREEGSEQVIVRILTTVNPDMAYRFWKYLGARIQTAISHAPTIIQDIAIERISFEVESIEDVTTV